MGNFTTKVDTIPPDVGLDINGSSGTNNWYISPTIMTATGSDATSGLLSALLSVNGGLWQSSTTLNDGVHTIMVQAQDNAGHVSTSSATISVDTTTPSISLNINGKAGQNGWYISNITVMANASDTTSGMETLELTTDGGPWTAVHSLVQFTDGGHILQFKATDQAGNITETPVQELKVDTLAPTIDLPASWKAGNTIPYTVVDTGSGLASILLVIEDAQGRYEDIVPL